VGGVAARTSFSFLGPNIPARRQKCRYGDEADGGSEHRTGEILALLLSYGRAAQPTLPALRELVGQFQAEDFPDWAKQQKIASLEKAISTLEATNGEPELRSFSD
jgi:hypothetical protein